MEDVLGFCALLLTVLMMLGVSVWFCCSIVEGFANVRRQFKKQPNRDIYLKQNRRLRRRLTDAAEENFRLRMGHRTDALRRKSERVSRKVA
jgi:hypothetical protein